MEASTIGETTDPSAMWTSEYFIAGLLVPHTLILIFV